MKQYQAKIVLNKYEGIHSKRNPAAPKCDKERPNSLRQSLRFEGPILGPFRRRVNFGHEFRNIMRWCICTSSSAPAVVGKKKSQSQNSAGMHLSVTHRLLSILNLTVGQHHGHAQFQVYRVILPEYISNIPTYQSAWFIMILHVSMKTCWEAISLTERLSLKFVVQLILSDLNNIKEWLTDHQAVFEGFTSDSVFGYLRIS